MERELRRRDLRSGFEQAQKHDYRAIEPGHVFRVEASDQGAKFGSGYGRDLIGHEPAERAEAIAVGWFDRNAEEQSLGGVRGKCTDGD